MKEARAILITLCTFCPPRNLGLLMLSKSIQVCLFVKVKSYFTSVNTKNMIFSIKKNKFGKIF
jgi:hypothetical protein